MLEMAAWQGGKETEQELAVEAVDRRGHTVHETRECQQGQEQRQRQRLDWMDARQLGQQGGGVTLLAEEGADVEPLPKPEGVGQVNAAAGEAEGGVEEGGGGRARSHGGLLAGHANANRGAARGVVEEGSAMWETELKVASAALQLQAQEARRLEHLLIQVA